MDIRIVSEITIQPRLFDEPLISSAFLLVDWETDELVSDTRFDSVAEAERAAYGIARPDLNSMAQSCADRKE